MAEGRGATITDQQKDPATYDQADQHTLKPHSSSGAALSNPLVCRTWRQAGGTTLRLAPHTTFIVSWMASETLLFIVALFNGSHNERSEHHE